MKLKIYVIKKQQLIWAVIILAILILCTILLINNRTKQTMNFLTAKNTYKADITNDGKVDTVVVNADNKTGQYTVNIVSSNGKGYILEPDSTIKSFGVNKKWWPLQISFKDVNDDGNLEVILQGSDKNGSILHVFQYQSGKMVKTASGRYSICGTIKNPDDNSTLFVLGSNRNSKINYTYLSTVNGCFTPYFAKQSLNLGKDTLSSLVSFIETKDVAACNMNQNSKFISKISKGNFLDAKLLSSKYTKYDIPDECTYLIRTSVQDGTLKHLSQYKIKLTLATYENTTPVYKIKDVDLLK